jgi:hypothetical protein
MFCPVDALICMLNALSQGNVKDVVDSVVMANCKILCSGIEEVCAFDSLPSIVLSPSSTCMPWAAKPVSKRRPKRSPTSQRRSSAGSTR